MTSFWLRWAWRDLHRRGLQVLAIAVIVGLGAGMYAGLSTTSVWRRRSLDESFARLHVHDVRVSVLNRTVDGAALLTAVRRAGVTSVAEARLVVRAPATASHHGRAVPAAGEIVGTDLAAPRRVDLWKVTAGRDLAPQDTGEALLDAQFAGINHLPPTGTIRVGRTDVRYVGLALAPGYLNLQTTSGEAIQGQATRAVLFAPIGLARRVGGIAPGQVNDVVATVRAGTSESAAAAAIQRAVAADLPRAPVTVTTRHADLAISSMYDEISSEQQLFDVFSVLIIAGAGFAVFMLTKRVVEAQRREIGIAMALGVGPAAISSRPLILAAEITLAGVAFGIGAGWLIAAGVLSVIRAQVPLPYWTTPFPVGIFARAALLGLLVPLVGAAVPVWRAVRVRPVEALVPAHLRVGRHRLTRLFRRTRLPGTVAWQTPLRRIVRAPVRSGLTVLAIAFIMTPLLAAFGATDSVNRTIDAGEKVLTGGSGDRLVVDLQDFQPATSPLLASITHSPLAGRVAPGLNTGGFLVGHGQDIGVSISMGDLSDPLAVPPSVAALHLPPGGIVISRRAASNLGVRPGDRVTLRHPLVHGNGFRFVDTSLPVRALDASPFRFVAYMDLSDARIMGLGGIVNTVKLKPRAGVSMDRLRRSMSDRPGVASALPTRALARTTRDLLSLMGNLFVVLQFVIAALAFLVAYNASNVGVEERRREHATMFAFGIPVRRVELMAVGESFALAVVGVGLSLGFGNAALAWILGTVFPAAVPDLAVLEDVTTTSYLITVGIALAAAFAAPWLNVRRLRNMDVPSTLRYVE